MKSKKQAGELLIACEKALLFGRVKRVSRERASERRSLSSAPRSRVVARLASLAQIGELARRLNYSLLTNFGNTIPALRAYNSMSSLNAANIRNTLNGEIIK